MNVVVLSPRFPFPLDKGDRLTVFHLLKYLSARHRVSLVCFRESGQDPAWVEEVAPYCARIECVALNPLRAALNAAIGVFGATPLQMRYYQSSAMRDTVRRVIDQEKPDLVYSQLIRMSQYSEPYGDIPRVAAFNLSMTRNYRRLLEHSRSPLARLFNRLEHRKLARFEGAFARRFDRVLYISKYDVEETQLEDGPPPKVSVIPHGVDFERFSSDESIPKRPDSVIMTGNMNYAPNADAALFLCTEILPIVRQAVPGVHVSLVGADPGRDVRALARVPGVEVTGRVPDLREPMNRATIAVAPIRIGAGLQNKVLEGMSMGLPMVATSVANEGIQAQDGENIMIGDTAPDFASRMIALLRDQQRRAELGRAAREFIVRNWSWEKHFGDLERIMDELVRERRSEA
jgi:sugar transferase (PEP-CTERM/EpsH1 system associated)